MAVLLPVFTQQFTSRVTGEPVPFGKVFTYAAGTNTPKAAYSDQAGTTPLTNPINLDANGFPLSSVGGVAVGVWVDGSYKYVLQDQNGVTVDTRDNVSSFVPGGNSAIDINGLTLATPVIDDTAPIYDISAAANRKVTLSSILGLMGPLINGLLPSNVAGTSTTATVTISAGNAISTNTAMLLVGTGFSWAVANGNNINGYQGGTTLPAGTTIHFYICQGPTGTGSFASTSLTPTLPTGYDVSYRRIFSIPTNGTAALQAGTAIETEGGSLNYYYTTPTLDFSNTVGTTAVLVATNVALGINVQHIGRYWQANTTVGATIVSGLLEPDVAPSANNSPAGFGYDTLYNNAVNGGSTTPVITNTSGQIRARANAAGVLFQAMTRGYKDFRR